MTVLLWNGQIYTEGIIPGEVYDGILAERPDGGFLVDTKLWKNDYDKGFWCSDGNGRFMAFAYMFRPDECLFLGSFTKADLFGGHAQRMITIPEFRLTRPANAKTTVWCQMCESECEIPFTGGRCHGCGVWQLPCPCEDTNLCGSHCPYERFRQPSDPNWRERLKEIWRDEWGNYPDWIDTEEVE